MSETLLQYGLAGVVIIGLAWYVMYLHKMYGKRVKDLEEKHEVDRQDFKQIARDGFNAVKESTSIITSMKTLFEIAIKQNK